MAKNTNSFVRMLVESTARPNCFRFYLTFSMYRTLHCKAFKISRSCGLPTSQHRPLAYSFNSFCQSIRIFVLRFYSFQTQLLLMQQFQLFRRSHSNQLQIYQCKIPLDGSNWFWYINHWTWVIILTSERGPPGHGNDAKYHFWLWSILYINVRSSSE